MLKLRNKTRGASKVGYLVKVVRGGFEYAGYGDTPIGVVTEICPAGRFCKIQTEGEAFVYVGKTVKEGQQIRMKNEDEKLPAGQSVPVTGDEDSFTSIGYTIGKGRGLVEVSLNIGSAAGGAGGGGGIEEAPLTGSQYARQSGAWSIVSSGISDATADSVAYSRYNNGWVNSNLIIDYSGGTGAATAVVNYDERLTIVGDGTYISSTYSTYVNGLSQTIHQIALSLAPGALDTEWYLASADGQQGTPRTVYDNRGIGNDAVVVFLDGAYTTVTQYVNTNTAFYSPTFGQAVNELTIEVDHAQLRTDGYLYYQSDITTLLAGYATQSWVTTNFDNYANWVAEANGTPVQTVSSGNSLNFAAGANMTVTWGGPDTLTFAMTTSFGTMSSWNWRILSTNHPINNGGVAELIANTGISIAYNLGGGGEHQAIITNSAPSPWTVDTNGITYTAGNVGIGMASNATYALDVTGDIRVSDEIRINGATYYVNISPETITFSRASSNYITAGTAAGTLSLTVDGVGNSATNASLYLSTTYASLRHMASGTATESLRTLTGGNLYLPNNVGIGINTPGADLDVYGTIAAPPEVRVSNIGGTWVANTDEVGRYGFYSRDASGIGAREVAAIQGVCTVGGAAGAFGLAFFTSILNTTATEKMRLTDVGNLTVTGGIYAGGEVESYDTSDIRLKNNVSTISFDRSARLLDASTIEYDHIEKDRHEIGLIAQEIVEIFPEIVKENDAGFLMIQYGKLVAPLLQIVQNQDRRILELERKLAKY